jgi:hypothetical protein
MIFLSRRFNEGLQYGRKNASLGIQAPDFTLGTSLLIA